MSDVRATLKALLSERILVLDGAMGTAIQALQLTEADFRGPRFADWPSDLKGNNDLLVLTAPARIAAIHRSFLDAGADIVSTNTFNATAISQSDYGLEGLDYELNRAGAAIAREQADLAALLQRIQSTLFDVGSYLATPDAAHRAKAKVPQASDEDVEELEAAIDHAWEQLCEAAGGTPSVAVRSSATAEDLPDASFAGQQETFLNVRGLAEVKAKIQDVFASLYNDRAISYRVHQGFAHAGVALSAGVQMMARSDLGASGVMFTLDTESGFRDLVFITASYELRTNIHLNIVVDNVTSECVTMPLPRICTAIVTDVSNNMVFRIGSLNSEDEASASIV